MTSETDHYSVILSSETYVFEDKLSISQLDKFLSAISLSQDKPTPGRPSLTKTENFPGPPPSSPSLFAFPHYVILSFIRLSGMGTRGYIIINSGCVFIFENNQLLQLCTAHIVFSILVIVRLYTVMQDVCRWLTNEKQRKTGIRLTDQ